ncbi:MAG TPA: GspH/FimT family pseudopilin [Candidatus Sumerlaeota bacterium]|nr:GspH/FimT family pseudopilin [Candidatus Sumerlaeota bacterium]
MERRRRGFTFFEIMLVIVIVGILTAVALPRMRGTYRRSQLTAAARELVGLMRYARNAAVLRELPVQIVFDLEEQRYQLIPLDENQERAEERTGRRRRRSEEGETRFTTDTDTGGVRRLTKARITALYTDAPPEEKTDLPRIIYYADGSATPATIVVQDGPDHALHVVIYRTTGMAKVEPGVPEEEPETRTLFYGPGYGK